MPNMHSDSSDDAHEGKKSFLLTLISLYADIHNFKLVFSRKYWIKNTPMFAYHCHVKKIELKQVSYLLTWRKKKKEKYKSKPTQTC